MHNESLNLNKSQSIYSLVVNTGMAKVDEKQAERKYI